MQIGFAEHDSACLAEQSYSRRIALRLKMAQRVGAAGCGIVAGIDAILDRNGQPVKQSQRPATGAVPIGGTGRFEHGRWLKRDERVQILPCSAALEQRAGIAFRAEHPGAHRGNGCGR